MADQGAGTPGGGFGGTNGLMFPGGSSDFDETTGTYRSTGTSTPPTTPPTPGGGWWGSPYMPAPGQPTTPTPDTPFPLPGIIDDTGQQVPVAQPPPVVPTPTPTPLEQSMTPQPAPQPMPQPTPVAAPQQEQAYYPQSPYAGDVVRQGIDPFLYGMPGFSPLMQSGLDAFSRGQQQVVQQQAELQGLGRSPAVGQMTSDALAQVLPQFIMADYDNRFKAAETLQGEEGLSQNAAQLAANIANQEQTRQLQAFQTGGNMLLGMGNLYNDLGQSQTAQMQLALQAAGAGGDIQQQIAQQSLDAAQAERLRLQALAEQSTTGLFSTVLPGPSQTEGASKSSGGGK